MPTWVPDYRMPGIQGKDQYEGFSSNLRRRNSCTGMSEAVPRITPCGKEITLKELSGITLMQLRKALIHTYIDGSGRNSRAYTHP